MLTFTGERAIPGVVEPDLWNEHVSRYYFARQFAANGRALDIGCGVGYGTNLISARAAGSLGVDVSPEAVQYAAARAENGACFCVASADAIPASDNSFGLITAFEVIEHVPNWKGLIAEAARTLTPEGVFLVSTPNKTYYAQTRQSAGPNPFHLHEFELAEFQSELASFFPHVAMLAQNHQEIIAFAGENSVGALGGYLCHAPALADSHFFLAVCSSSPVKVSAFLYAASGGNMLKERETHINLLQAEVESLKAQAASLAERSDRQGKELHLLGTQLSDLGTQLNDSVQQLGKAHAEADQLRDQRRLAAQSKWLRLGRRLGLGPKLEPSR